MKGNRNRVKTSERFKLYGLGYSGNKRWSIRKYTVYKGILFLEEFLEEFTEEFYFSFQREPKKENTLISCSIHSKFCIN